MIFPPEGDALLVYYVGPLDGGVGKVRFRAARFGGGESMVAVFAPVALHALPLRPSTSLRVFTG
jgi:hypothetical protein